MAISNELSGEIAAAILSNAQGIPSELSHLKETVLKIHSVLQDMEKVTTGRVHNTTSIDSSDRMKETRLL